MVKAIRKRIAMTDEFDGSKIFTKVDGKKLATPMFLVISSLSVPDDAEVSTMHSSEIASPSSFTTNPSKGPSATAAEEEEVIRGDHHPSPAAAASHQSQLTQTGAAVEIDLTLRSRSLSYQIGSQGYVMNRVHEEGGDRDRQYIDAETELGREVALCIEQREKALQELQVEAALLRKAYLEAPLLTRKSRPPYGSFSSFSSSRPSPHKHSSFSSSFSMDVDIDPVDHDHEHEHEHKDNIIDERVVFKSDIDRLQPLLAKMNSLRRATMEFADAYGAWYVQCTVVVIMMDWTVSSNHSFLPTLPPSVRPFVRARLLHKQKAIAKRREKDRLEEHGASYDRMTRTYSVVVAFRGSTELYPVSQPVLSNVKKFSRGREPVKYSTESKLVGSGYRTREEAVKAFEK
jgi:hypothetical protein